MRLNKLLIDTARGIHKGASLIKNGFVKAVSAATSSYLNATVDGFNFFGGSEFDRIGYIYKLKNNIEKFIHIFSGAYIFGFLGSFAFYSIMWTGLSVIELQNYIENKPRENNFLHSVSGWWKYTIGLPGFIIGCILSVPINIVIFSFGPIFTYAFTVCALALNSDINGSSLKEKIKLLLRNEINKNPLQIIFGIPGIIIGLALGTAFSLVATAVRMIKHSIITASELSGGILNIAFNDKLFDAFNHKRRFQERFMLGLPGLCLACVILPIAAAIITARHLVLIPAIVLSPIVALYRASSELYKLGTYKLRFSVNRGEKAEKLKILFANLNMFGELQEGATLHKATEGATYQGGFTLTAIGKFIRKIFTFNQQTLTEKMLTKIYNKLRNDIPENNEGINKVINDVSSAMKRDYTKGLFISSAEKERVSKEIEHIANYARNVLQNSSTTRKPVPHLYEEHSYHKLFLGYEDQRISVPHSPVEGSFVGAAPRQV